MKRLLWIGLLFFCLDAYGQHKASRRYRYRTVRNTIKASNYRGEIPQDRTYRFGTIGFQAMSFNYYGDLAPRPDKMSTDISLTKPGFAITYNYKYGVHFSCEGRISYGTITGSDKESALDVFRQSRNLSFKNRVKDMSAIFIWDIFPTVGYYVHRPRWNPYFFAGVALSLHNPLGRVPSVDVNGHPLEEAGQWVKLRALGTEGQHANLRPADANYGIKPYKLIQPNFPIGYGAKLWLSKRVDLKVEFCFRYYLTDYLDDVSRNYVDLGVLQNNLARTMSYRTFELPALRNPYSYIGRDDKPYTVESGYGSEYPTNIRGNRKERDAIFTVGIGVGYMLGAEWLRAKFR